MNACTIPDALHICPGCHELTTGESKLCFSCALYEDFYRMKQARERNELCARPVQMEDSLCSLHLGRRLLLISTGVIAFFVLLPYAFRVVFWAEKFFRS